MEEITSKQKYKLRKFIKKLETVRGRHTELVSVYIPQGYEIIKIIQHLEEEKGTASNIKDTKTRKHVQESLERLIRHLRIYKKTPENGLVAFAGDISQIENKTNIEVFSIEPPLPLKTRIYRCDQYFVLDILKDQLEHKEVYALIVLDKREANVGLLKGNTITKISTLTSGVPGKYKTGGQSAMRFSRLRELAAHEFYKRIADVANKEFLENKQLKGILIGGPGPTKEEFFDGDYLNNELKKKVLAIEDITYTDEFGLQNLVDKAKEALAQAVITKEKEILNKFFTLLSKEQEKTTYGREETKKALEMGAVDTLLVSEALEDESEDLIELAENSGSIVEIISLETQEGIQLKNLGGIGAILRFQIK